MAMTKTITLYNKVPEITQKKYVSRVSNQIVSVMHAPEGTKATTREEFMKVAKQYWEFGVDVKQRLGAKYVITPCRCLFTSKSKAEEARSQVEQIMLDRNLKIAMEEYKKSKWKDEVEGWDESNNEEGEVNENQF